MSDSRKITEACESLEVSHQLGAEYCDQLAKLISEYGSEIAVLENAKTYEELFEQLLKMRAVGVTGKLIQACHDLKESLLGAKKAAGELGEAIKNFTDGLSEGDSWKG